MLKLSASVLIVVCLVLSGCTSYRPLYGAGADGKGVAVALSGIAVEEQKERAAQIVRNNLISAFGGGGSAFVLRLKSAEKTQQLSVLSGQKLERLRYTLKIAYELADAKSGSTVVTGTSFSNVSYDTVQQPIADLRAAENAKERAAREVADDIRLRLAAHFSSTP
jgi:LPS-assembly lipoprotein